MNDDSRQSDNAFIQLQAAIDERYPQGRFVAIENDRPIADAASLEELHAELRAMNKEPRKVLVVRAGTEMPVSAHILASGDPL